MYVTVFLGISPVWKGGSCNTNELGCNAEKKSVNKGSPYLCKLGFKLPVLLAASSVALRKLLLGISPLEVVVQSWLCHRGIVRINAAEAGKHRDDIGHLAVFY